MNGANLDRDVLTAFACVIADQQLRACLDVLKQVARWFEASPSAEAAVWSTVRRLEATRAVVRGISDTLMADMEELADVSGNIPQTSPKRPPNVPQTSPKRPRGRPRKTVSNVNEGP